MDCSRQRICLLITGMHCGGNATLASIMHYLGADLPRTTGTTCNAPNDAHADNSEQLAFVALNDEILASAGTAWKSPDPVNPDWYASPRVDGFKARAVALLESEFEDSPFFVLSDPRIGRLLPFWQAVLEECRVKTAIVAVYREPEELVRDLQSAYCLHPDIARLLWLRNHLEAERATRGMPRSHVWLASLFDDFETVVTDISKVGGFVWPAFSARARNEIGQLLDERSGLASGARAGSESNWEGNWIATARSVFSQWAASGENPEGHGQLDGIRAAFDSAMDHLGRPLDAMIALSDELRRNQASVSNLLAQIDSFETQLKERPEALFEAEKALGEQNEQHRFEITQLRAALKQAQDEHAASLGVLRAVHEADLARAREESQAARNDEARRSEDRWAGIFSANQFARERLDEQNVSFQRSILQLTEELGTQRGRLAESDAEIARLGTLAIAHEAEAVSAHMQTIAELRGNIKERNGVIRKLRENLEKRSATIENLRESLVARDVALAQMRSRMERDSASGTSTPKALTRHSWAPALLSAGLSPRMMFSAKARREATRHRKAREILGRSPLFNAEWYRGRYPDIVAAGLDPLDHFIRLGGAEGRHPSEEFNSRWYLNQYPDIREAGLNPLLHYLEYGLDEGRLSRSLIKRAPGEAVFNAPAKGSPAPAAEKIAPKAVAAQSEFAIAWKARNTPWSELAASRNARAWLTHAELSSRSYAGAVAIGTQVIGLAESGLPRISLERLRLFASLRKDLPENARHVDASSEPSGHASDLGEAHEYLTHAGLGINLLTDVWFAGEALMRIRMDCIKLGGPGVVRAYQYSLTGELACCGEGALVGTAADMVDVKIDNQMLGLLLIVSDDDATVRHVIFLPFPSLARGGFHYGELACIEGAPGYVGSLADYSQSLALEFYGWPEGPASYSVGRIAVDLRGATGIEPIFRQDIMGALSVQYGAAAYAVGGRQDGAMSDLARRLAGEDTSEMIAERGAQGATLELPADCLPSLYSLVSRRIGTQPSATSYCVVDAASLTPNALVCIPIPSVQMARLHHTDLPAQVPLLTAQAGDGEREDGEPEDGTIAAPLAVRFYNPLAWQVDALMPVSPDQEFPLAPLAASEGESPDDPAPSITVIIDLPTGAQLPDQLITSLASQSLATRLEVLLAFAENRPELESLAAAYASFPFAGPLRHSVSKGATRATRLNEAASVAQGQYLLFIDPEVLLIDPRTVSALLAIAMQPGVGSAACAIVTERDGLEPSVHSGGYFPTRMGLCADPLFEVSRLDVARALPAATYPVMANQLKCCMVPSEVWTSLGGLDAARFPAARFDLDLGYRAGMVELVHYCTTLVRAASLQEEFNADFPDAIAHRALRITAWQPLLDRVTVIRELHR